VHTCIERKSRTEFLDMLTRDGDTHKELLRKLAKDGVIGAVLFENLDMSSSEHGRRSALICGPRCETLKSVADARGQHLGDVPSRFQWPVAAYVENDKDWDEEAINPPLPKVFETLMTISAATLDRMTMLCKEATAGWGDRETVFHELATFDDGCFMEIMVITTAEALPGDLRHCNSCAVLRNKDGKQVGGEPLAGNFTRDYTVRKAHTEDTYTCRIVGEPREKLLTDQQQDKLAEDLGIPPGEQAILDRGSNHPGDCTCSACQQWWRLMGPDPGAELSDPYGPFPIEQIEDDSEDGKQCEQARLRLHLEENERTECLRFVCEDNGLSLCWDDSQRRWFHGDLRYKANDEGIPTVLDQPLNGRLEWDDAGQGQS